MDINWQKIRDALAKDVMGWVSDARMDGAWYVDQDGNPVIRMALWEPYDSWGQAGMIVEAMEQDGWELSVHHSSHDTSIRCAVWGKPGTNLLSCWARIKDATFPQVIALAAYRTVTGKEER